MWALSLCAGLGGQCQAFVNHPLWRVVRIDINPKLADVAHMRLLDVNHWLDWYPGLELEMGGPPDVVIFAPDCEEFSMGYNAPKIKAKREGREFQPSMELLESGLELIEFISPRMWIVENVMGAIEDFKPYLGEPRQIIGPFVFWGAFGFLDLDASSFRAHKKGNDPGPSNPLRKNHRALWPIEISENLLNVVMSQSTLNDWC